GQVTFEPLHYLALLERKPGALDYARPLAGWSLPEPFAALRRRLEGADPKGGHAAVHPGAAPAGGARPGGGDGRRPARAGPGGHRRRRGAAAAGARPGAAGGGLRPERPAAAVGGRPAAAGPGRVRRFDLREGGEAMSARRVPATDVVLLKHHLTTLRLPT